MRRKTDIWVFAPIVLAFFALDIDRFNLSNATVRVLNSFPSVRGLQHARR